MREFIISTKNQGKKLFNFVKKVLPGLKNTEIFKLIRKKIIVVNNKKIQPEYILKNNDVIKIFLQENHFIEKGKKDKFISVKINFEVIYEDNNILVINKPKGLLCHPDKKEYKNTLYEMVRSYLYKKNEFSSDNIFNPTPCHRIDKNTSGIVVVAKNQMTLKEITGYFRDRKVEKKYYALVYGKIDKEYFLVSKIDTDSDMVNVKDFKILEKMKDEKKYVCDNPDFSATIIYPKYFKNDASLIEINLLTGKKHQIRAHLKEFNHPLLGDRKYYNEQSMKISKKYKFDKYFLHSFYLKIDNYKEWTVGLPWDFNKKVKSLFKDFL